MLMLWYRRRSEREVRADHVAQSPGCTLTTGTACGNGTGATVAVLAAAGSTVGAIAIGIRD